MFFPEKYKEIVRKELIRLHFLVVVLQEESIFFFLLLFRFEIINKSMGWTRGLQCFFTVFEDVQTSSHYTHFALKHFSKNYHLTVCSNSSTHFTETFYKDKIITKHLYPKQTLIDSNNVIFCNVLFFFLRIQCNYLWWIWRVTKLMHLMKHKLLWFTSFLLFWQFHKPVNTTQQHQTCGEQWKLLLHFQVYKF